MDRLLLAISAAALLLPFVPTGDASPTVLTVTSTSYSTGGVFHVEGTISGHVRQIAVSVPGGSGFATIDGDSFTADVTGVVYGPGTYDITLQPIPSRGHGSVVTATVTVVGVYTVYYDRELSTSIGAYANAEPVTLPHLYGGSIVVDGLGATSGVAVAQVGAATDPCLAVGAIASHQECAFTVRPSSSLFGIAWVQAGESTIRVTISGYAL